MGAPKQHFLKVIVDLQPDPIRNAVFALAKSPLEDGHVCYMDCVCHEIKRLQSQVIVQQLQLNQNEPKEHRQLFRSRSRHRL